MKANPIPLVAPGLAAEEVVSWFRTEIRQNKPIPNETQVVFLVHWLNIGGRPAYLEAATAAGRSGDIDAGMKASLDVAQALATLKAALPIMVERWNRGQEETEFWASSRQGTIAEQAARLRALKMAVNEASKSFSWAPPLNRDRRGDWHSSAMAAAKLIANALFEAGWEEVSFTSPNSPAIKILKRALHHVDQTDRSPATLADAVGRQTFSRKQV